MMQWLMAWWRQIFGHPESDPWRDDPRIREERRGQHDRINRVTGPILRDSMHARGDAFNERVRRGWGVGGAP